MTVLTAAMPQEPPTMLPSFNKSVFFLSSLLALSSAPSLAQTQGENQFPTEMILELRAQAPSFLQGEGSFGIGVREMAEGLESHEGKPVLPQAGKPELPMRKLDVLLPPDADLESLSFEIFFGDEAGDKQPVIGFHGFHYIRPVKPGETLDLETGEKSVAVPEGVQFDAMGHDLSLYGKNFFFPGMPVKIVGTGSLRMYQKVNIVFSPYLYNMSNGMLLSLDSLHVKVKWDTDPDKTPSIIEKSLADPIIPDEPWNKYYNWIWGKDWYINSPGEGTYEYLIITTRDYVDDSDVLEDFVDHKESQGLSVGVISVDTIYDLYSTGERADRIRSFLQEYYADWGVRYVLFIGDPDPYDQYANLTGSANSVGEVPMKMAWPRGGGPASTSNGEACPTDHYFADLSDDWDVDGDGYAGEWADDVKVVSYNIKVFGVTYTFCYEERGIDFDQEVYVGRVPFASTSDADAVLSGAIDYQSQVLGSGIKTVRKKVFLAMSHFSSTCDTSYLGNALESNQVNPRGLNGISFYEPGAAYTGDFCLENEALINYWTSVAAGLVVWTGHGSSVHSNIRFDDSDLMRNTDAPNLYSQHRAYAVMGSCQNGRPEESKMLAAEVLLHGGVGSFAGTRNSWYVNNKTTFGDECYIQDVVHSIAVSMMGKNSAGRSVALMRSNLTPSSSTSCQDLITYNLYGDPHGSYKYE